MPERAIDIAKYFIKKAADDGSQLTPMKALKLVYIAHGWHLAVTGEPLVDDRIEAWKYGPVIPPIYKAFRDFGNREIPEVVGDDLDNETVKPLLDRVWDQYKNFSALQLSTLTHNPGTPWDKVWRQQGGCNRMGEVIPAEVIKEHYRALAGRNAGIAQ